MVDVWEGEEWYHRPPRMQEDSVTIIAAPVSGTKYEWREGTTGAGASLGDQSNVRIISIVAKLTWATTQPDPLEIYVTMDGQTFTMSRATPVTDVIYAATIRPAVTEWITAVAADHPLSRVGGYDCRSLKLEVEITWAITQPTNLTMRVKWAKWP